MLPIRVTRPTGESLHQHDDTRGVPMVAPRTFMTVARTGRSPASRRGRVGLLVLTVALLVACVPNGGPTPTTTTTAPPPPRAAVRFVLLCAADTPCSGSKEVVQSRAYAVRSWYRERTGRTLNLLKVAKVTSPRPASYFRVGGQRSTADVEEILARVRHDPALENLIGTGTTRKLVVVLGFDALKRCGAAQYSTGVVNPFHGCQHRQSVVYAHELGHTFGLAYGPSDRHRTDGSLMHEPMACAGKPLSACSLNSDDRSYFRDLDEAWFGTDATGSAAWGNDYEPYGDAPWDASDAATTPLYKYFNATAVDHFYTVWRDDPGLAAAGWTYQGCVASVFVSEELSTVPLERWWSGYYTDHFYTSEGGGWPASYGYSFEGISEGFVYSMTNDAPGSLPFHRYFRPGATPNETDHFYTTERSDQFLASLGYQYQRVEANVLPPPEGGCP